MQLKVTSVVVTLIQADLGLPTLAMRGCSSGGVAWFEASVTNTDRKDLCKCAAHRQYKQIQTWKTNNDVRKAQQQIVSRRLV